MLVHHCISTFCVPSARGREAEKAFPAGSLRPRFGKEEEPPEAAAGILKIKKEGVHDRKAMDAFVRKKNTPFFRKMQDAKNKISYLKMRRFRLAAEKEWSREEIPLQFRHIFHPAFQKKAKTRKKQGMKTGPRRFFPRKRSVPEVFALEANFPERGNK